MQLVRIFFVSSLICLTLTSPLGTTSGQSQLYAAVTPAYKITLQKFELKSQQGPWVTVIQPDRIFDLAEEEVVVSFFNTTRRVPEGMYINFRLTFQENEGSRKVCTVSRKWDIPEPLAARKGSFIYALAQPVLGGAVVELQSVSQVKLTVDERSVMMGPDEILIEYQKGG